jgi:hypothetical protein
LKFLPLNHFIMLIIRFILNIKKMKKKFLKLRHFELSDSEPSLVKANGRTFSGTASTESRYTGTNSPPPIIDENTNRFVLPSGRNLSPLPLTNNDIKSPSILTAALAAAKAGGVNQMNNSIYSFHSRSSPLDLLI